MNTRNKLVLAIALAVPLLLTGGTASAFGSKKKNEESGSTKDDNKSVEQNVIDAVRESKTYFPPAETEKKRNLDDAQKSLDGDGRQK